MNIVVWKEVSVDEDGTQNERWIASHVGRAITATGMTKANAVYMFVRWLKLAMDPKDNTVPPVDLVVYDAPEFPEDHILSPESNALLRKKRLTREDQAALFFEAQIAYRVRGLVAPEPKSHHHYPPSISLVQDRFDAGVPFVDENVAVPDGWDVRVWEG